MSVDAIVKQVEEAITRANTTDYGLAAAVWSWAWSSGRKSCAAWNRA